MIGELPAWRGVDAAAAAQIVAAKAQYEATLAAIDANVDADIDEHGEEVAEAMAETQREVALADMQAMLSALAGAADTHVCSTPQPPHGAGVVINGSATVLINGLPEARQGDSILEVAGPENRIAMGFPTVLIGG